MGRHQTSPWQAPGEFHVLYKGDMDLHLCHTLCGAGLVSDSEG